MAEIAFLIIAIALAAFLIALILPYFVPVMWLKKLKKQLLCFVQISM